MIELPCGICPGFWRLIPHNDSGCPLPRHATLSYGGDRTPCPVFGPTKTASARIVPRKTGRRARSAIRRVGVAHAAADRASHRSPSGAARDGGCRDLRRHAGVLAAGARGHGPPAARRPGPLLGVLASLNG